jgi:mitogen-activated protein kinase kinase kinase
MIRPSAAELIEHPWMLQFKETLRSYEEAELADPPAEMPPEDEFQSASVARQAAIIQEKAVEELMVSPDVSPEATPSETPQFTPSIDADTPI